MGVVCLLCNKFYASQSSLNRHRKETHNLESLNIEYAASCYNYKCLEPHCDASFKESGSLRHHLQTKHGINNKELQIHFDSYEEFQNWLYSEEKQNNVQYFKGTGTKNSTNSTRSYYYCVRSGYAPQKKENLKRFSKSQGSSKANVFCTSTIIVNEDCATGNCKIQYNKMHYGHTNDICHLRITREDKKIIASKLMLGIPSSKIVSDARGNIGNSLSRINMVTRQDVYNIANGYRINLKEGCRHSDDATSVDMWVHQCRQSDCNPVLFYKRQGEPCSEVNLTLDDFCIIIMDKLQSELFRQFGTTFIAIDSTHGLNAYDFEMTTLLTIDEFHQGMPIAFMFSNRKDSYINEVFFQKVKDLVGPVKTDIFMSDITNVFYNPWSHVMGSANKQLYCSWHIDRAWQCNLIKINCPEKKEWTYKTLKFLQTLLDREKFMEGLQNFLNVLDDATTNKFKEYFQKNYVTCIEKWAYCFRIGSVANTNMHLESMHKTLKYYYLQGKKIKRLDKTIHVLMEFLRNKKVDRIIKLTKGEPSELVRNIRARHRLAISTQFDVNAVEENKVYAVKSSSAKNTYIVTRNNTNICCPLKCSICCICFHTFSCTCVDFCIKMLICKHIHYVVTKVLESEFLYSTKIETKIDNNTSEDVLNVVKDLATTSTECDKLINEINNRALGLLAKVKTKEQLKLILNNIKNAESVSSIDPLHFKINKECVKEPPNKKIAKQISFHSTHKKNKTKKGPNRKPDLEEMEVISETLYNTRTNVNIDFHADHLYCTKQ